jgi:hypothetical protein
MAGIIEMYDSLPKLGPSADNEISDAFFDIFCYLEEL